MKRLAIMLALALAPALAFATLGSVVSSFEMPTGPTYMNAYGMAWDGEYLWICGWGPTYTWRLTTTGSLVSTFLIHGGGYGEFHGATFDGQYLWFSEHYYGYGISCTRYTTAGSWVSSFEVEDDQWRDGMAYEPNGPGYLWCGFGKYTTAGSFISSFAPPHYFDDAAWDGHYLWGGGVGYVFQVRTNGSLMASFTAPDDGDIVSTTFDGLYLWLYNVNNSWFYRVDIEAEGVNPASFGKLKSLFR